MKLNVKFYWGTRSKEYAVDFLKKRPFFFMGVVAVLLTVKNLFFPTVTGVFVVPTYWILFGLSYNLAKQSRQSKILSQFSIFIYEKINERKVAIEELQILSNFLGNPLEWIENHANTTVYPHLLPDPLEGFVMQMYCLAGSKNEKEILEEIFGIRIREASINYRGVVIGEKFGIL